MSNVYRRILATAILITLPFLVLYANTRHPEERGFILRSIIYVQQPLVVAVDGVVHGAISLWDNYLDLFKAREERDALEQENADLLRQLETLREQKLENERLRGLLEMKNEFEGRNVVSARVILVSVSSFARTWRIDRGAKDGIKIYDPVLSNAGLVGKISIVGDNYAEIFPITDIRSMVAARLRKNRAPCVVAGGGLDKSPDIIHLMAIENAGIGDEVVTEAVMPSLPDGILIGTIEEISTPPDSIFVSAKLNPAASISRVEEVIVLASGTP